jgi:hypothetical protein
VHDVAVTVDQLPLHAELTLAALARRGRDPNLPRRDRHAADQALSGRLVTRRCRHPKEREQRAEHGERSAERLASPSALLDRRGGFARHGRT